MGYSIKETGTNTGKRYKPQQVFLNQALSQTLCVYMRSLKFACYYIEYKDSFKTYVQKFFLL